MIHTIKNTPKLHFYAGTDLRLAIHTDRVIEPGDILNIGKTPIKVNLVTEDKASNYHKGDYYYELSFLPLENQTNG